MAPIATDAEIHQVLGDLIEGPAMLGRLVTRTPDAVFDHRDPERGGWTAREILAHLADLEFNLNFPARVARVLGEERPELAPAEADWRAIEHRYGNQEPRVALGAFTLARKHMVTVLRSVPPAAWDRVGLDPEEGPRTLLQIVQGFVRHEREQAERMRELFAQAGFRP